MRGKPDRYFNKQGAPISPEEWHRLSCRPDYRDVCGTEGKEFYVSTIWTGTGEATARTPQIFETTIFCPAAKRVNQKRWTYATLPEAKRGHEKALQTVQLACGQCHDKDHGQSSSKAKSTGQNRGEVQAKGRRQNQNSG